MGALALQQEQACFIFSKNVQQVLTCGIHNAGRVVCRKVSPRLPASDLVAGPPTMSHAVRHKASADPRSDKWFLLHKNHVGSGLDDGSARPSIEASIEIALPPNKFAS